MGSFQFKNPLRGEADLYRYLLYEHGVSDLATRGVTLNRGNLTRARSVIPFHLELGCMTKQTMSPKQNTNTSKENQTVE
jgi:hypothetical protein